MVNLWMAEARFVRRVERRASKEINDLLNSGETFEAIKRTILLDAFVKERLEYLGELEASFSQKGVEK